MDDESWPLKSILKSNKVSKKVTILDDLVCNEMNLSRNDLDECKYRHSVALLDYTLKLTGKFIQFSGLKSYQTLDISISLSGKIDFNFKGV